MTIDVIALPGGVMPAAIRYQPLAAQLPADVRLHTKDLEVYAGDEPPENYSIQLEVDAVTRFADSLGLDRFHLLGYSGGGFVSLAVAGAHPDRLLSLSLFEPASIPGPLTAKEAELFDRLRTGLDGQSGASFMETFIRLQLRDGVTPPAPPAGPTPPWMANRPAGLAAMMRALGSHPFDRDSLRNVTVPVFWAYGELTGVHEEIRAGVIVQLFPDVQIRRYTGIHHFVPAAEIYTAEHVQRLLKVWHSAMPQPAAIPLG